MRFVVHIGMAKTGTTSIQRFLADNRAALGDRGVLVPTSLESPRHDALPVMGQPTRVTKQFRRVGATTPAAAAAYQQDRTAALRAELAGSDADIVALSSEQLSTLLKTTAETAGFAEWLGQFGLESDVLVYLRRQDSMYVAAYSTAVKRGVTRPFEFPDFGPAGPPRDHRLNYRAVLERWESAFGAERLKVRLFERERLIGGDVVVDYLDALGISDTDAFTFPEPENVSLARDTLEFLRLMNRTIPARQPGVYNPLRGAPVGALTAVPSSAGKVPVPADRAAAFVAQFAEGNAEVAQRYFPDQGGELFSTRFRDIDESEAGLPALTVERAVEIAGLLWNGQQAKINELRQRLRGEAGQGGAGSGGGQPDLEDDSPNGTDDD